MEYNPNAWEALGDAFTNNYEQGLLDYRKNIIDTIIEYEFDCSNLLDIACADGWFIEQLRDLRAYVPFYTGIDITPNLIKRARKRMPDELFMIDDAMDINLPDNRFDFVLCAGILMHLPDYKKAISEACRVSNKYVMFSTYGTYRISYRIYDDQLKFLNHFYTIEDIMKNVPSSFDLIEFKSFPRMAGEHMFQFLYKKNE